MSSAIVSKDIRMNRKPGHHTVPDARIHRHGMDQDDAWQARIAGGAEGIGDRAVVRSLENTLVHSGPR
jgi:hypothetical protein